MSGAHVCGTIVAGLAAVALAVGCASPYPAVLTSAGDKVAIEFETDGSLAEATKLAEAECAKSGKNADFDEVDQTATPSTRIARFKCVSDAPAEADAPASAESDAVDSSPAPESSDMTEPPAAE